jgi:hypothetical protein
MWPELGAGRSVTRIKGPALASVEYRARRTANRPTRKAADALSARVNLGGILGCDCRDCQLQNGDMKLEGQPGGRWMRNDVLVRCSANVGDILVQFLGVSLPRRQSTFSLGKTPLNGTEDETQGVYHGCVLTIDGLVLNSSSCSVCKIGTDGHVQKSL